MLNIPDSYSLKLIWKMRKMRKKYPKVASPPKQVW